MPRNPLEKSNQNYYHVTARSNNKEFFYLPMMNVWDIMSEKLSKLQCTYQIKIAAFVLMNNHFHLLFVTPNEDIDRIMYFFMKDVTLEIQKCSGRINKIFDGRYKGTMIESYGHLVNVYKYIYRNPVEVNIIDKAEDYPFSSLFFKTRPNMRCPFRIETIIPKLAFDQYENLDELIWINQRYEKHEAQSISCGLQKTIFAYEKDKVYNKPIEPIVRHPRKKTQEELWADLLDENQNCLKFIEYNS